MMAGNEARPHRAADLAGPTGGNMARHAFAAACAAAILLDAATALLTAGPGQALAQAAADAAKAYPERTVILVVPFSAGSMTDILARTVAEKLSERWRQQVVVENRPGMAGTAGVAKAPADGHTLMLTSNGHTVTNLVNPNVAFDPVKDFTPVSKVASSPMILVVAPEVPAKSLKELVGLAKAKPGSLNYSSAGLGSASHIAAELLKQTAGMDIVHVPHRGMIESATAVLRNDVAMTFTFFSGSGDLIQVGRLRALAVSGNKRLAQLPEVPTFAEAGLPEYGYDAWFGIMAPAGTPRAIVAKVGEDIAEALRAGDMKARFDPHGVDLVSSQPEEFEGLVKDDVERYRRIYSKRPGG
jgi:tripartite-type tricarboxylate transporter receptor subunit TctC